MRSPFEEDINLAEIRINTTRHGRSKYRKRDVPGHNVVRYYNTPGVGDGIDLFAPAGTPVVACHSGKITRIFDRSGKLSGCYIYNYINNETTVYAHLHLKEGLHVGQKVSEGEVIGYIGRLLSDPHLHFERECAGRILSGPTPEAMRLNLVNLCK